MKLVIAGEGVCGSVHMRCGVWRGHTAACGYFISWVQGQSAGRSLAKHLHFVVLEAFPDAVCTAAQVARHRLWYGAVGIVGTCDMSHNEYHNEIRSRGQPNRVDWLRHS